MKKKYPKETIVDLSYHSFLKRNSTSPEGSANDQVPPATFTGVFDESFYYPSASTQQVSTVAFDAGERNFSAKKTDKNKPTDVNGLALRMYFLRFDDGKGDIRSVKVVKN